MSTPARFEAEGGFIDAKTKRPSTVVRIAPAEGEIEQRRGDGLTSSAGARRGAEYRSKRANAWEGDRGGLVDDWVGRGEWITRSVVRGDDGEMMR